MMDLPDALREKVLREVIDTAPFPIGVYTGDKMKIVLANKCMIETYGKGPDVIGLNYTEILPELENQLIFDQLRDVLKTGIPYEAKNSRVDIVVEGELKPHYFNYNFTPIFGEDRKVYGVMNTAAEVTALNVSRQQTIDIEKRLRLAVESSKLGTFEIDLEKCFLTGSKRFLKFFGTPQHKFSLSAVHTFIHASDKDLWKQAVEKMYSQGQLQCEVRIQVENAVQWLRLSGTLSESDNKENIIVGIAQDITEEKEHSEELKKIVEQRTAELKRSNDDLKQFGHVVSHDLKEPLRKISMFSNLMLDTVKSSDLSKTSQYAQKINKSSARVSEMIDAILTYSSSGSLSAADEAVDLNLTLQAVSEDLELKIAEKNAVIEYGEMPCLSGSSTLLYQLFLNLISNSLKFSRAGSDPHIKIECGRSDQNLYIKITDNGIGIAAENSQRIFNTFERLHSKDQYEGTGLGLSLCRKIAERHKGKIRLVPAEIQGAVFEITFPLEILC